MVYKLLTRGNTAAAAVDIEIPELKHDKTFTHDGQEWTIIKAGLVLAYVDNRRRAVIAMSAIRKDGRQRLSGILI